MFIIRSYNSEQFFVVGRNPDSSPTIEKVVEDKSKASTFNTEQEAQDILNRLHPYWQREGVVSSLKGGIMEDMTFEQWMEAVNAVFVRRMGFGYEDFPDQCYRDMYDDGLSPEEAFDNILDEL